MLRARSKLVVRLAELDASPGAAEVVSPES
jgi:hypothetical protein